MRINKYLAECGLASRRNCEQFILDGRVKVNGKKVTNLGIDIDTENDTLTVDGKKVKPINKYTFLMFNKPKGCVTTVKDEKNRKTVYDYLQITDKRLFPIGRLDYDSEGLLIFTNDGDTAYKLTHPKNEIPKSYIVKIKGEISESELALLRKGIELDGFLTHRAKLKVVDFKDNISRIQMTIYEGRNREIRRMFEKIDKEVVFLKRVAIGDLKLGGLGRGQSRYLSDNEIFYLQNL